MTEDAADRGLQPERTELAWRRTALSLGIAALVGFRVISDAFGDASWVVAILFAIVIAGAIWVSAHRRYTATSDAIAGGRADRLPGGGLLAVIAVLAALIALGGALAVVALVALPA